MLNAVALAVVAISLLVPVPNLQPKPDAFQFALPLEADETAAEAAERAREAASARALAEAAARAAAQANISAKTVVLTVNSIGVPSEGVSNARRAGTSPGTTPDTTERPASWEDGPALDFAYCLLRENPVCPTGDPAEPGEPSLSDIATFIPQQGTAHMQYAGVVVVGTHTNFYADATTHTISGTLLDKPAAVRFTPVGYSWDYGNGDTRTVTTPGDTWEHLGLPEFSQTATSSHYEQRGDYTITMRVIYSPSYRYDTDTTWKPINGTLSVASPPLTTRAVTIDTVLVDKTCDENPKGIGCQP